VREDRKKCYGRIKEHKAPGGQVLTAEKILISEFYITETVSLGEGTGGEKGLQGRHQKKKASALMLMQ